MGDGTRRGDPRSGSEGGLVGLGVVLPRRGAFPRLAPPLPAPEPRRLVLGDEAVLVGVEPIEQAIGTIELLAADAAVVVLVLRLEPLEEPAGTGPALVPATLVRATFAVLAQAPGDLVWGDEAVLVGVEPVE